MKKIFESNLERGFLDLWVADGTLIALGGPRRGARTIGLEFTDEDTIKLVKALMQHLGQEKATTEEPIESEIIT